MSSADLSEVDSTLRRLKEKLTGTSQMDVDVDSCADMLDKLKLKLTAFPSLPPLFLPSDSAQQQLQLARDVLEQAVILSVIREDEQLFERNFLQLSSYYSAETSARLPPSPLQPLLLSLHLLRLLVQHRTAEFHTHLELLPPGALSEPHVAYVMQLEQRLMEGAYLQVLQSIKVVPVPLFSFFCRLLEETVREEIASCSEKAYESLSLAEAKVLLMIQSEEELVEIAAAHNWTIEDGTLHFAAKKAPPSVKELPALQLISQALTYARELERIV